MQTPAPFPSSQIPSAPGQAPGAGPASERARIKAKADRARYDAATIHAIVDDAWLCHVAFACPDVMCMPTVCWRIGDHLCIHGSNGSRMMKHLASGAPACVSITHLDGLVMARSAFSHSMNYRSVVIHGAFEVVADADKPAVLEALTEHIATGRSRDARTADMNELKATTVLAIPLWEASAKIREGGPKDKAEDLALPVWAGVLPLREQRLAPQAEAGCGDTPPAYVTQWAHS